MGLVSLSCCLVNVLRQEMKTHACSPLVTHCVRRFHCSTQICNVKMAINCRQPNTVLPRCRRNVSGINYLSVSRNQHIPVYWYGCQSPALSSALLYYAVCLLLETLRETAAKLRRNIWQVPFVQHCLL